MVPAQEQTISLGLKDGAGRLPLPAVLAPTGPGARAHPRSTYAAGRTDRLQTGVPAAGTHLPLLLQATAHPLEVGPPPVAPVPAAAFPAVPLRLLEGPTASPGVVQEVPHRVGLQHTFLRAQGVAGGGGWRAHQGPGCSAPPWHTHGTDPLIALILCNLLHLLVHLLDVLPPPLLPLLVAGRTQRQRRQGSGRTA